MDIRPETLDSQQSLQKNFGKFIQVPVNQPFSTMLDNYQKGLSLIAKGMAIYCPLLIFSFLNPMLVLAIPWFYVFLGCNKFFNQLRNGWDKFYVGIAAMFCGSISLLCLGLHFLRVAKFMELSSSRKWAAALVILQVIGLVLTASFLLVTLPTAICTYFLFSFFGYILAWTLLDRVREEFQFQCSKAEEASQEKSEILPEENENNDRTNSVESTKNIHENVQEK